MAKKKTFSVGEITFTETGKKEFVYLSKEQQIDYIASRLSPKSRTKAEKLLKGVEYGEISDTVATGGEGNNTSVNTGGGAQDNTAKPEATGSKKKGV